MAKNNDERGGGWHRCDVHRRAERSRTGQWPSRRWAHNARWDGGRRCRYKEVFQASNECTLLQNGSHTYTSNVMLHDYRKEIASVVQTKRSIPKHSGCTTSSASSFVSTESDKTCTSSFVFTPATRGRRLSHVYTKPGTTGARDSFPSPRSSSDGADETTAHPGT